MNDVFLCIGNREGGDDAVGPYIADKLESSKNVINCETTPENYTSVIKKQKPERLLIIDAADMNLKPGEIRIIPKEKIGLMTISTHGIPISLLIKYLEKTVENILFIGIQPENMSGEMSDDVKKSADRLIQMIYQDKIKQIKVFIKN